LRSENFSRRKFSLVDQKVIWKRCTYDHLIYRVDYIIHLVPCDEAIVVHVIQTKGPWKEIKKGRKTRLISTTATPRRYEIVFSFHARFFRELVISVSLRPYSRPRILGKAFILYLRSVVIDNSFLEENNREGLSSYVAIVFHKLSRILCVTITQILIGNKIFRKRGY